MSTSNDLFENYTELPADVQAIIDELNTAVEDGDTAAIHAIEHDFRVRGYVFSMGLDGVPYGLKRVDFDIMEFGQWLADGNAITNTDGTYSTQDAQYTNRLKDLEALKAYYIKEFLRG